MLLNARPLLAVAPMLALLASSSNAGLVVQSGARHFTSAGSGATIADGEPFTVTGSGFGTNVPAADQAFLGGINGPIEIATDGANIKTSSSGSGLLPTGWKSNTGYSSTPQFISTGRAFSGTKSILNRFGYTSATGGSYDSGEFQYGISYDFGAGWDSLYIHYRVYYEPGTATSDRQVKFWRANGGSTDGYTDGTANNTTTRPNMLVNQYESAFRAGLQRFFDSNDGDNTTAAYDSWVIDGWAEHEVWLVPGTAGNADGSVRRRYTDSATGTVLGDTTVTSTQFLGSVTSAEYRYIVLQLYFGNGAGVDGAQLNLDRDFYAIVNKESSAFPKHVWLCDASDWESVTKRLCAQQQYGSTWNDTTISIPAVNLGPMDSAAGKYFYVMEGINDPINTTGIPWQ